MIEILVGMIASGKSTYARKRADEGAIVVSHDDLTQMLHARYRYEQGLRAMYRRMEEEIALSALLDFGRDAVIDRTHLTRESRERWLAFRDSLLIRRRIIAVVFPVETPGVHAGRRFEHDARGRSQEEWLAVANHHFGQWHSEPIEQGEGFDEIRYAGRIER